MNRPSGVPCPPENLPEPLRGLCELDRIRKAAPALGHLQLPIAAILDGQLLLADGEMPRARWGATWYAAQDTLRGLGLVLPTRTEATHILSDWTPAQKKIWVDAPTGAEEKMAVSAERREDGVHFACVSPARPYSRRGFIGVWRTPLEQDEKRIREILEQHVRQGHLAAK